MEDEKRRKKRKRIAVIVLLVVAALVYGAVSDRQGNAVEVVRGEESADSTGRETEAGDRLQDGNEEQEDGEEKENAEIYVDVGGAVVHPGVVNIAEGSRVFEAVQAAGGTTSEAETKYINMASECTDGQKLYIPTAEEAEKAAENGESAEDVYKRQIVLCVSLVLAAVSSFFVRPDAQYAGYIDFETLSLLLSLMIVMAGFQKTGLFRMIGEKLISKARTCLLYTSRCV